MATLEQIRYLNKMLREGKSAWVASANAMLYLSEVEAEVTSEVQASQVIRSFLNNLLEDENYLYAATLLWGSDMFNVEPECVQRVFNSLRDHKKILLQGASSMSKTYSGGAWMLLDWMRDPMFTTIKVISRDEGHLKTNLFAHIWSLLKSSAIPVTENDDVNLIYRESELFIGLKGAGPYFGFHGIAVKHSADSTGDLKGFKPKPMRSNPHPIFGKMSRLRVLGDECVRGDQRVTMEDGQLIQIKDLVESKNSSYVMSFNRVTQKIEPKKIYGWHKVPRRGREMVNVAGVIVTEDHPILTAEQGYVLASDVLRTNMTCLKYIHEDLFPARYINGSAKIPDSRWTAWGLFNIYGGRVEGECADKVYSGSGATRLLEVEIGDNGEVCRKLDKRAVSYGVRGDCLQLHDLDASVFYGDLQGVLSRERAGEKDNARGAGNVRPNGDCCLVHGRWLNGIVAGWSGELGNTGDVCLQQGGGRASSVSFDGDGGGLCGFSKQGTVDNSHEEGRGECAFGFSSSLCSQELRLQDGWECVSRAPARDSESIGREYDSVYVLRNDFQEIKESEDLLKGVQQNVCAEPVTGMETAEQDEEEWVYCIDVEDNHNFFAEGVCVKNCQNWPAGPFTDLESVMGSMQGKELVKIAMSFNPEDVGRLVVQKAEPPQGWLEEEVETLYEWESKEGWHVTRLDGARSENVIAKKDIYPGFQTYEGYLGYLKGDGSDSSPKYYCFGRGWPPIKGTANNIIPANWPNEQRGEAVWIEKPIMGASIDLAFQGADTAQMAIFKWGLAKGKRNANGKYEDFVNRTSPGIKRPRHVLEIVQLIQLEKSHDSIQAGEEIMARCKMLGIAPEWVVVDMSGNALGTYSHLKKYWGNVLGLMWGDKATDMLVLAEDAEPAHSRFSGIMSEMWFAFREWLNPAVGAILINPIIPSNPLFQQLTSRRFRYSKNSTMKVESKDEYKSRNQKSPDEADSIIQIPQLIRLRGDVLPGMVEQYDARKRNPMYGERVANLETADEEDSVCADGSGSV